MLVGVAVAALVGTRVGMAVGVAVLAGLGVCVEVGVSVGTAVGVFDGTAVAVRVAAVLAVAAAEAVGAGVGSSGSGVSSTIATAGADWSAAPGSRRSTPCESSVTPPSNVGMPSLTGELAPNTTAKASTIIPASANA
jgi:hypothetical protein